MTDETQVETPEAVEASAPIDTPIEPEVKAHPAHEKLLAELPEAWHAKITPHLQDFDRNVQKQLEQYAPYKEFVEAGISPDILRGGVNLAKAIETQPMDVYESLTAYLKQNGLLAADARAAAREIMEDESGEDFEDIFDDEQVPAALKREIDELKNFQKQQQDYMYQQQLEVETQKELQKLESDMDALRSKYSISEAHEVAIYDLMNAAINAGREISVEEAARQLSAMIPGGLSAGAPRANAEPAPMVIGSAGGAGIQAQDLQVPKDDQSKRAMLEKLFADYKRAAQ